VHFTSNLNKLGGFVFSPAQPRGGYFPPRVHIPTAPGAQPHGGNEGVIFPQGYFPPFFYGFMACGSKIALVSHPRPCGDGALWKIWAAGASHAGGSSSPGHSAAAVPMGLLGPPIHNMGLCSRPGEDSNAWKQFGPEPIRAIEPRYRPPGQQWILDAGLRGGGSE